MSISIVIPNYNGENLLKKNLPFVLEALQSYKKNKNVKSEIIVVDDASSDKSWDFLLKTEKELKNSSIKFIIAKNKFNKGFSSTVNEGVNKAQGSIVILLNTDVRPRHDFIVPLVNHFLDKNAFSVGCLDESIEDGKTIERGRGIGKWERGFLLHRRGEVNKANTLWTSGGSAAFRKDYWIKLGGFYEIYNPFYWEDIDISYRAQKAGYKIIFEKRSVVVHVHEEGSIKSQYNEKIIKQIAYRNQFYFVWINITDPGYILNHLFWLIPHFLKAIVSLDEAFIVGFFAAFKNIFLVLQLRIKTSRFFIKNDRDVLKEFIS